MKKIFSFVFLFIACAYASHVYANGYVYYSDTVKLEHINDGSLVAISFLDKNSQYVYYLSDADGTQLSMQYATASYNYTSGKWSYDNSALDDRILWIYKIVPNTTPTQITLQNFVSGKYLRYSSTIHNWTVGDTPSSFSLATCTWGVNGVDKDSRSSSYTGVNGDECHYLHNVALNYTSSSHYLAWDFDDNKFVSNRSDSKNSDTENLSISVWVRVDEPTLTYDMPELIEFGLTSDGECDMTPRTFTCPVECEVSVYFKDANPNSSSLRYRTPYLDKYFYEINDITDITNTFEITIDSYWYDDESGDYYYDYDEGIFGYDEDEEIWNSRICTDDSENSCLNLAANSKAWDSENERHVLGYTVTPYGNCPMASKSSGSIVNSLEDQIYIYDDLNGDQLFTTVRRKAYLYETEYGMTTTMSPSELNEFDADGGSVSINVGDIVIKDGTYYYEAATPDIVAYSINNFGTWDGTIDYDSVKYDIRVLDENNNPVSWAVVTPSGAGKGLAANAVDRNIVLTVLPNGTSMDRSAKLNIQFSYKAPNGVTYSTIVYSLDIEQTNAATSGPITFNHRTGAGDTSLDERGNQRVHTYEKTIYYIPNETIPLIVPEPSFTRYVRWYDYNTNHDPAENNPKNDFSWVEKPKTYTGNTVNSTRDCKPINSGAASMGLYDISTFKKYDTGTKKIYCIKDPKIKAWTDGVAHDIACDLSNYGDGGEVKKSSQVTTINEPTLSYRTIFHFLPASQMADSLMTCTGTKYLETHKYIVPKGKKVWLETDFRYKNYYEDSTELCYWYRDNGTLKNVGGSKNATAKWYKNNNTTAESVSYDTGMADLLPFSSSTTGTTHFYLRFKVGTTTYNIAHIEVEVIDNCGPSATALVDESKIGTDYLDLAYINFDGDPLTPPGSQAKYAPFHLDWEDISYGFYYPSSWPNRPAYHNMTDKHDFSCWGEYALYNTAQVAGIDWVHHDNHGGKSNGYALFVDGMASAGLVATISADTRICSGQLMYCSAWLAVENNDNSKPIFRFNVQGRNSLDEEWHDVGVFETGEMAFYNQNSNWQQVMFPLVSAQDYQYVRVSLYNFASSGRGNDFMVDDIRLFASKLPLNCYQVNTSCKSTDAIISVIRLDYQNLRDARWNGSTMYYDLYNASRNQVLTPVGGYNNQSESSPSVPCGSFTVPSGTGNPSSSDTYSSISDYIAALEASGWAIPNLGFVKEDGRWILYLVHKLTGMNGAYHYQIRMAQDDPAGLLSPQCVLTSDLKVSDQTGILFNGEPLVSPVTGLCANDIVTVSMDVNNVTQAGEVISGSCMADWLIGIREDEVFLPMVAYYEDPDSVANANAKFKSYYGYSRDSITAAIWDMRREDAEYDPLNQDINPNREISNAQFLVRDGFNEPTNYDIIIDLVDRGLLQLRAYSSQYYMESGSDLYYWIYPISGSGQDDEGNPMLVCDEPVFVSFHADLSDYNINYSAVPEEEKTEVQKMQLSGVRVSQQDAQNGFTVPIREIKDCVMQANSTRIYATDNPNVNLATAVLKLTTDKTYNGNLNDYYHAGDNITFTPASGNTVQMLEGYTYTFATTMLTTTNSTHDGDCPVGESYFRVIVVPDTMIWTPKANEYNDWSDDDNWRAVVNGKTLDYGFVPMEHTNVIIPALSDPSLYPYISGNRLSVDAHYNPMTCKKIHFMADAKMDNQHKLLYEEASVELDIPAGNWYAVSVPLQDIYSGDMYMPLNENTDCFIANQLTGARGVASANHFWASYFNRSVNQYDITGQPVESQGSASEWIRSNGLDEAIVPGGGFGLLFFGPDYAYCVDNDETRLLHTDIRLPKQDDSYSFSRYGSVTDITVTLDRDSAGRFALQLDEDGEQTFTLTNAASDTKFLFGNPSMEYIDMWQFLSDNAAQGVKTSYYYAEESQWVGATLLSADKQEHRYLAPMRAALIETDQPATSLTVTLKNEHLTLNPDLSASTGGGQASVRARYENGVRTGYLRSDVMNIRAYNANGSASMRICMNNFATDTYMPDEDAPFIYSPNVDISILATPMNIYSLAGDVALTADVRQTITRVPLAFLIDTQYATDSMYLHFNLSFDWPEHVWLYDQQTDLYYPIYDGITFAIETPDNHALRYYIVGASEDNPTVPTALDEQPEEEDIAAATGSDWKLYVYNMHQSHATLFCDYPMTDIVAYDLAGRVIAHIAPNSTSATLQLPQGVALFEVTTPAGKRVVRTIIK